MRPGLYNKWPLVLYFDRMSDQRTGDPHNNIPGAEPQPPSGEFGPSAPAPQDPHPAPFPARDPNFIVKEVKRDDGAAKKGRGLPPLFIVGFVVFGFAAAGLVFSLLAKARTGRQPVSAAAATPTSSAPTQAAIEEVPAEKEGDIVTNLAAVTKAKREMPALALGGILYSDKEGSVALIDGKVVPEGGMVKGVKVVRILPDKVELEFDDRRIFMRSL